MAEASHAKMLVKRANITIGSVGKRAGASSFHGIFAASRPSRALLPLEYVLKSCLLCLQRNETVLPRFDIFTYRNIMTASFTELGLSQNS